MVKTTLPWPQPIASHRAVTDEVSWSVDANSVFKLKCGLTSCEYELIPYQFLSKNVDLHEENSQNTQLDTSTEECPRAQHDEDLFSSCFNGITMATTIYDDAIAQGAKNQQQIGSSMLFGRMLV